MRALRVALLALAMAAAAAPAPAVQPDEILDDPALEARAREISKEIRCLVCRNESIDDSNAGLARDLRLVIRERLVEGDSDTDVRDFLVARYGEYVLLNPPFSLSNALLWLAGPLMLLGGGAVAGVWLWRQRSNRPATPAGDSPLTEAEQAELARLLAPRPPQDP